MIFITVGNMDPFDRLLRAIDEWLSKNKIEEEVLAQIGTGQYSPQNFRFERFLTPTEYDTKFKQASFVVGHAGMGTIIAALESQKPLVIMPKKASLGEQRNEHQTATANYFSKYSLIHVANNETELPDILTRLHSQSKQQTITPPQGAKTEFPPDSSLLAFVRDFVSQSG